MDALIPDGASRPSARAAWTAAILLSPLAMVSGFLLLLRTAPTAAVNVTVTSEQAVDLARAYLEKQGLQLAGWSNSYGFYDEKQALTQSNERGSRMGIWAVAPPLYGKIRFKAPRGKQGANVSVSLDGKVIGFELIDMPRTAAPPMSQPDALRLASSYLPPGYKFGPPAIETEGGDRVFKFRSNDMRDFELNTEVRIAGSRVISAKRSVTLDTPGKWREGHDLQDVFIVLGGLFACLVFLFSIYRYASRTMEREVSHRRSLIVAVLCGLFFGLIASNSMVQNGGNGVPPFVMLLIFAALGFIGGAILAVAYGSGEGDVREAFPGKLTTLDGLLTGHLFARNVGVSILFGLALCGWLLLGFALLTAPFRSTAPQGFESMLRPFTHYTWMISIITAPLVAVSLAAGGLLQPVAFCQRYLRRKPRWHLPVLVVSAALIGLVRSNASTNWEFFAQMLLVIAGLLLPFFLRDLLATMVCIAAFFFLTAMVVSICSVPGQLFNPVSHLALGLLVAGFALASTLFGKDITEEEVRPLYARHIAQRKSLEAEVSAAREAQLRLLPQRVPEVAGLNIAASCIPAETVGGDFYDFFSLPDGRLGLFIADGNNHGLAAALTIALAKGYLMHRVSKSREPLEIVVRLETALRSMFGGSDTLPGTSSDAAEFAFATIDTERGEIRYARTGAYPKVILTSARESTVERLTNIEGRAEPIVEGRAALEPGDCVLLFTDGIGRRLGTQAHSSPENLSRTLRIDGTEDAEEVRKRVMIASRTVGEPDDLTVVVVQVLSVGAAELEGVA